MADQRCDYRDGERRCLSTEIVGSVHGYPRRWLLCEEHIKPKHHPLNTKPEEQTDD